VDHLLIFIRASILAIPPVTAITVVWLKRRWPSAMLPISAFVAIILCCAVAAVAFGIHFVAVKANALFMLVVYFAFCYFVWLCWYIPNVIVRIPIIILSLIPIGFAYFLGTIGLLVVVILLKDAAAPPLRTQMMGQDLICRISRWGFDDDRGYTVHLVKLWRFMPFLEHELDNIVVSDMHPRLTDATCEDVMKQYTK
jgi:hypothetical protein